MIFGSSCCLLFFPDTLEVFRTSSVNRFLANNVAKFFLEQLLRKICVVSPDVSWGAGTVLLLVFSDVLSGGEFASVTTWLTSRVLGNISLTSAVLGDTWLTFGVLGDDSG